MKFTRLAPLVVLAALAALTPSPAQAADLGTSSIRSFLAQDGATFDAITGDFDVYDALLTATLAARPTSSLSLLDSGATRLTVLMPTDAAFRKLVEIPGNSAFVSEFKVTQRVMDLGIDKVEALLQYGMLLERRLLSSWLVAAHTFQLGTQIPTASITVDVISASPISVRFLDDDPGSDNPYLIAAQADLNSANQQVAHAITRVPQFVLEPVVEPTRS